MVQEIELRIADHTAAIRYLGEIHSRPLDPIHEPIQNLLDENARVIDIDLDRRRKQIRVSGDADPIVDVAEAQRILQSICSSSKVSKLGEKGIGMLSFVNAGEWMVTKSQHGGKHVWFKLERDDLGRGKVGSNSKAASFLPYAGTQITIGGVPARYFRAHFSEERVHNGIRRRWAKFIRDGITIRVNGAAVASESQVLQGDPYSKTLRVRTPEGNKHIYVDLTILKEPSDAARVSITHKGQANFDISNVGLFSSTVFTMGWLHGTISGDIAPVNASRTGFAEGDAFDQWQEVVMELHDELERLVVERSKAAAEQRDQAVIEEFMSRLRKVFSGSELSSVATVRGEGDRAGWGEPQADEDAGPDAEAAGADGGPSGNGEAGHRQSDDKPRKGSPGRHPTVPHGGFGEFAPSIRVWRGPSAFKINVKHPDYVAALKNSRKRRDYIREICIQEAYIYSLDGPRRRQMEEHSDLFMGYWTKAFLAATTQAPKC